MATTAFVLFWVIVGVGVVLAAGPGARRARVERLSAPSLKSQNNVTFGGRGWGGSTSDGVLEGKRKLQRLKSTDGTFRVVMPAGSAALVEVPAPAKRKR